MYAHILTVSYSDGIKFDIDKSVIQDYLIVGNLLNNTHRERTQTSKPTGKKTFAPRPQKTQMQKKSLKNGGY
jgi:hypothetical protein